MHSTTQLQVIWKWQWTWVYIISLFPPHAEIHSPRHTSPISDHHWRPTVIAKRPKFVALGRKFQKLHYSTLKLPLWLLCNIVVAKKKTVSPQQEAHTVLSFAKIKPFVIAQRQCCWVYSGYMPEKKTIKAWFNKFLATVRVHKQPTRACESVSDEVKQICHMFQRSPNLINLSSIQALHMMFHRVWHKWLHLFAYKVQCPGDKARQATSMELCYCCIVSHEYESWLPSKHLTFWWVYISPDSKSQSA
jgi:hypothetical protein